LAIINNIVDTKFKDIVDNLGRIYILLLFISGAIWAFVAVNNFDTSSLFKVAMIYSMLLIFGFIGVSYDRRKQNLGIDSRIWDGDRLQYKLAISVIFFFIWYLVFMKSGFAVATAQSTGGTLFSTSPTLNFLLVSVFGPLAEDIFFFGVCNITLITLLRELVLAQNREVYAKKGLIMAAMMMATYPLFVNVPNAIIYSSTAAILVAVTSFTQNKFLLKHAPIFASALIIGGLVFPRFHSYAYQLNERSYVAATYFGTFMCLITSYVGLLPVDIIHIANNIIALS
jgi:hypothetical protein